MRQFLSPGEERLLALPEREARLFRDLFEIGAHLVEDPKPDVAWMSKPTTKVAREVSR